MFRRVIFAGLSTCLLALTFAFSHTAIAGWIDSNTGQGVRVNPPGWMRGDGDRAHIRPTGQNVRWVPCPPAQPGLQIGIGIDLWRERERRYPDQPQRERERGIVPGIGIELGR